MHESLEKIKEYCGYYDWYDHVSIYDMRYLISEAEKANRLEKQLSQLVCAIYEHANEGTELMDIAEQIDEMK